MCELHKETKTLSLTVYSELNYCVDVAVLAAHKITVQQLLHRVQFNCPNASFLPKEKNRLQELNI